MRLASVSHGHSRAVKAFFALVRKVGGREPPDILKTLFYRPEFFGLGYSGVTQEIMRGPSPWSVGERELFASFTSSLNQCVF